MKLHPSSVMPEGFHCASVNCGLKDKGTDLSLFMSEVTAHAAAVFTLNRFPGAPVIVGREIMKKGKLRAIVVNSKVSNVGTGELGILNARKMGLAVAKEFDIDPGEVLMSSTGVIGKPLPIERIEKGISGIGSFFSKDPLVGARGIMTTDTHPKALSLSVGNATLTMVAKGAGMIEPNMATMLVYIFTDAAIQAKALDMCLREAVDSSFNMLSVDTDTSTSDTCVIMANGLKGPVDDGEFSKALSFACIEMTKKIARDGEGATKLLTSRVKNAFSREEARFIAKSIINSPLIKTMAYGADPNIGRVLMALGKCFHCHIEPADIEVMINGTLVYKNQNRVDFDEQKVRNLLSGELVDIEVNVNAGSFEAVAYGCDLTQGYIEENAAYYSS
ncbi:MAG: bifunctional glutamate N-acetyltransferase/amino-acid acetyltransferase ArgJ [Proteobacteria bacterium]|nr:bifunctional glutamate N-acetyltransferase/amino-acid acetyltransferase ArgJ [Pseudomonadota bacterium]MBU4471147.1 bifunctional glutamate N-acetyltransferase/amino-acid acetyltransferase ArgJ [Pseudomonadota bacterium]MCG2750981.1 bifunctional glutamate N-acetyltransferase/amino-acid acetyltransferase ArgJ [Desulfobacteraceae bacterium]